MNFKILLASGYFPSVWRRKGMRLPQVKSVISAILLLGISLNVANAQEVYSGQYVVRVYSSKAKQNYLKNFIAKNAGEEFEIVDETRKSMLVRTDGESSITLGSLVSESDSEFCSNLRRKHRLLRKRKVKTGALTAPSRLVCVPNAQIKADFAPNDSYYGLQYALGSMNVPSAWDLTNQLRLESIVAVVDTGIDLVHPDLKNRLWTNSGEIAGNGIDDDGNGFIDDVHGFNFIANNGNPQDDNGHGTHVSGSIAAQVNNATGVAGVDPLARIVAVKVLDSQGSGSLYGVLLGITYVNKLVEFNQIPIRVSNYSLGGGGYYSSFVSEITRAKNNDILFVAAAGNNTNNNDSNPSYPASYDVDNVISVAAIDSNNNKASFTNYGATTVDISAPGVDIASTYPSNRYVYLSGTSMATPNLSGVLSLAYSYSGAGYSLLKTKLFETGAVVTSMQAYTYTGKKPDARALIESLSGSVNPNPTNSPTVAPTESLAPSPSASASISPSPSASLSPSSSPSPSASPRPSVAPFSFNINTKLYNNNLEFPIEGVVARFYSDSALTNLVAEGVSGYDGIATLTLTGPISGYLAYTHPGYISEPSGIWPVYRSFLDPSVTEVNLDQNLKPKGIKISGKVVDENNNPIESAHITIEADYPSTVGLKWTSSKRNGEFTIFIPHGYDYVLKVERFDYNMVHEPVTYTVNGEQERLIVMKRQN